MIPLKKMDKLSSKNSNIVVLAGSSFDKFADERMKEYRLKWKSHPLSKTVERFPIHLDIESTSICNLKCPFCVGTYDKSSLGDISLERFKKIIDEGAEKGLYSIKLNFRGEPLLHKHIAEMVLYAKEKGIVDVFFNTNAVYLDKKFSEELVGAGLDRLIVSFEGHTKKEYEKSRVGAVFEEVVSNIRNFVRLRNEMMYVKPVLRLQTVNIGSNDGFLQKYMKLWSEIADEVTCIDLRDETADYTGLSGDGWECPYLWLRLCVGWDGTIYTCPFVNQAIDQHNWLGLGSMKDISLEQVWLGKSMAELREAHRKGLSHTLVPCKYCSYRGAEILKRNSLKGITGVD